MSRSKKPTPVAERRRTAEVATSLLLVLLCGCLFCSSCTIGASHYVLRLGVFAGSNWDVPENTDYRVIDDAIARFEKTHPSFVVQYDSGIRKSDYSEWLASKAIEGDLPDVFMVLDQDFSLYAHRGALKNLDGLIESDPEFSTAFFYPSTIELGRRGSSQYGIPYESNPEMMFVNVSLLEKNGIPLPESSWSLADLRQIVQAVSKDTDDDGVLDQFGIYNYTWRQAAAAYGLEILQENGETSLATPQMKQAISYVNELDGLQHNTRITQEDFDQGKVAFSPFTYAEYKTYQPYPWKVKRLSQFEWTCIPMPSHSSETSGTLMDSLLLSIYAKTPHAQAAWDLIKILTTDPETRALLIELSAGLPSTRISAPGSSMSSSSAEQGSPQNRTVEYDTALESSMIESIMENAQVVRKFPGYGQILDQIDVRIRSDAAQAPDLDLFLIDLDKQIRQYSS